MVSHRKQNLELGTGSHNQYILYCLHQQSVHWIASAYWSSERVTPRPSVAWPIDPPRLAGGAAGDAAEARTSTRFRFIPHYNEGSTLHWPGAVADIDREKSGDKGQDKYMGVVPMI